MDDTAPTPEPQVKADPDAIFGGCPECGRTNGYTNMGRDHYFYCKAHKTAWYAGTNLFSSWQDETEEYQRRQWNEIGLPGFREVKPLMPEAADGQTQEEQDDLEWALAEGYGITGGVAVSFEGQAVVTDGLLTGNRPLPSADARQEGQK